jgi:zinc D-Ala-D-Ala carboxypeptidase
VAALVLVAAFAFTVAAVLASGSVSSDATPATRAATPSRTDPDSTDPDSTDPDSTDPDSTDPDSYGVVVNKRRPLPAGFVPSDLVPVSVPHVGTTPKLRAKAARAVESLFTTFTAETGLHMRSNSAYRSFSAQKAEYAAFTQSLGASEAAETTARPGFSEHQTGLAIDIGAVGSGCDARACFAETAQSHWLASNAWRFGFIIRYPRGQQAVTGYSYEPWHIRYVGRALAKKIHGHYSSLEAYFHLAAAPTY